MNDYIVDFVPRDDPLCRGYHMEVRDAKSVLDCVNMVLADHSVAKFTKVKKITMADRV